MVPEPLLHKHTTENLLAFLGEAIQYAAQFEQTVLNEHQ